MRNKSRLLILSVAVLGLGTSLLAGIDVFNFAGFSVTDQGGI